MANMTVVSKKKKVTNKDNTASSSSTPSPFWSLPDDLIDNCVARISRSYYPSLSMVSKSFRSLISSPRLQRMRSDLGTKEEYVCVCLKFPNHYLPSWYSLWIKKTEQTLTMDKQNSTGNLLVPIPSCSYTPCIPKLSVTVGSETYTIRGQDTPSDMWISNGTTSRKAPSMSIPRSRVMNSHAVVINEKIYVMGGCEKDESTNWAEVFDTRTQTWESLPDPPGEKEHFSLIKNVYTYKGTLLGVLTSDNRVCIYYVELGKWENTVQIILSEVLCPIENVMYSCFHGCLACYDSEIKSWRRIMGMDLLHEYKVVGMTHYGGKLIVFFEDRLRRSDPNKKIWCAMVRFERRQGVEVWGQIEWTDIVFQVPQQSTLLTCALTRF